MMLFYIQCLCMALIFEYWKPGYSEEIITTHENNISNFAFSYFKLVTAICCKESPMNICCVFLVLLLHFLICCYVSEIVQSLLLYFFWLINVFCTYGPVPRDSSALVTYANNYKTFRALCLLTVYFVSMCVQWMGYEWGRVKCDRYRKWCQLLCFSKERLSVLLSSMTEGDVQHESSRTHGQAGALTDGTIVDTHTLSEGQKFKPGQSLWMWWIGDSFCLTDHDKKC